MAKKHKHKKKIRSFESRNLSTQKGHHSPDRKAYGRAPYRFVKRRGGKSPLSQTHEKLLEGHYDIAFEIEWTASTPIALNPCIDYNERANYPEGKNTTDYAGYNRRWLTIESRPAISPFTVKSAIANAFANLIGGCYRVNTKTEGHRNFDKGQYPYPGKYKRYRVAMDGSSRPGIIREIRQEDDGARFVRIQPVKEYYLDDDLPDGISPGDKVNLEVIKHRGHRPPIVKISQKGDIEARYHGPYHYGMNLTDPKGSKHKHRFYEEYGDEVEGIISKENFLSMNELKELVYLGGRDQNNNPIPLWYEDLSTLREGDFVYFETFNGRVCHIGKNFLFKALFLHEDTIPPENETCKRTNSLCPRCSLFGMVSDNDDDAVGFKGRFKASTLVADDHIVRKKLKVSIPFVENDECRTVSVEALQLIDRRGAEVGRQFLLPVQGPPKPNKRDVDGYYDKKTGFLKGAKIYRHTRMNRDGFIDLIKQEDRKKDIRVGKSTTTYSHNLRNWAEVLYEGITFSGTVGSENCTLEEIGALMMILHTPFSGHGFKLGLGKAIGIGTVVSRIKRLWLRSPSDYRWKAYEIGEDLTESLDRPDLSALNKALQRLKGAEKMLNSIKELEHNTEPLRYPEAGLNYWKKFNQMK